MEQKLMPFLFPKVTEKKALPQSSSFERVLRRHIAGKQIWRWFFKGGLGNCKAVKQKQNKQIKKKTDKQKKKQTKKNNNKKNKNNIKQNNVKRNENKNEQKTKTKQIKQDQN